VAPGALLRVGDPVTWTYVVTNDGDVALTGVTVTDDQGVVVSCPNTTLPAGGTMTCTGSGLVIPGPYANVGTATGTPPVGLTDVTDSDASHYIGFHDVTIDVHPGSDVSPINIRARGKIPVAILTTDDFDAADVDATTVTAGDDDGNDSLVAARRNGTLFSSLEDVDGDGDLDLILYFNTRDLVANGDLDPSTTVLVLNGSTLGGHPIIGSDAVVIVP